MKKRAEKSLNFLGMLGFLPTGDKKDIALKWLENELKIVFADGVIKGMEDARKTYERNNEGQETW